MEGARRPHTHARSHTIRYGIPACEIRYHVMDPWPGSVHTMNGIPTSLALSLPGNFVPDKKSLCDSKNSE